MLSFDLSAWWAAHLSQSSGLSTRLIFSLIVHIAGLLTAVVCLSSTLVTAQRKHTTNPTSEHEGEGTPADGLTVGRERHRLI